MNEKCIIVNADDLGMSRGITDAVILAHLEGIVTSASLMVNQPATRYALEQLRLAPRLDVGIHLNICKGPPVLSPNEVPSLVAPSGNFYPFDQMKRRLWRCQVSLREIEAEFRAQIRWMKRHGVFPTHVDSHDHIHFHPNVVIPFFRAVRAEGIRRARPSRHRHWPQDGSIAGSYRGSVYRRVLLTSYLGVLHAVVYRNLAGPSCCILPHPRYRQNLELLSEGWRAMFSHIPAGTYELTCHPGYSEPGFSETDKLRDRRELELRMLIEPQFRDLVEKNQIALVNYSQF